MARRIRPTGPGKTTNYTSPLGVLGRLYNFDIDGDELKPKHKEWLDRHVVPILLKGGSATIRGFASTKGNADHNLELSRDRMYSVEDYLMLFTQLARIKKADYVGEQAASAQTGDNVENEFWRAVDITAWEKPTPPEPPKTLPPEVTKEQRILHREFMKLHSKMSKTEGTGVGDGSDPTPKAVADLLAALGFLGIKALSSQDDDENLSARRTIAIPIDQEVIRLEVATDYTTCMMVGPIVSEDWEFTQTAVDYTWGATTPSVVVHKKEHWRTMTDKTITAEGDHEKTEQIPRQKARADSFYTPPKP
jgi:hypothetical protein